MPENRVSGMLASLMRAVYVPARIFVYVLGALVLCGLLLGVKGCWDVIHMTK